MCAVVFEAGENNVQDFCYFLVLFLAVFRDVLRLDLLQFFDTGHYLFWHRLEHFLHLHFITGGIEDIIVLFIRYMVQLQKRLLSYFSVSYQTHEFIAAVAHIDACDEFALACTIFACGFESAEFLVLVICLHVLPELLHESLQFPHRFKAEIWVFDMERYFGL